MDMKKIKRLPFLVGLDLADSDYDSSSRIDLLLSSYTSNVCFRKGTHYSDKRGLKAERTVFGWVVTGSDTTDNQELNTNPTYMKVLVQEDDPEMLLRRFWEVERLPSDGPPLSSEEQLAVEHFKDNLKRDSDGRYRVSLPRKVPTPVLGKSRETAVRCYISNERSLKKKGTWDIYKKAVDDYCDSGHSELVPEEDLRKGQDTVYYFPMHGVVKESSSSTKVRAVCDGSAKTSTGISINDTLLPGPSLYPLLSSILNHFRSHPIGMTADISRMFREVGLNSEEHDYHRYVHRDSKGYIRDWRMSRLTFGVTSSPFLATQVLRQLAKDYRAKYPTASCIVDQFFYVDDVLTGAVDIEHATDIRSELNSLLSEAKMRLCKWRTNSAELLNAIPSDLRETSDLKITPTPGECSKTLGVHWSTGSDSLHVATPQVGSEMVATKRQVASVVAKIFDVMGWFCPATSPPRFSFKNLGLSSCLGMSPCQKSCRVSGVFG